MADETTHETTAENLPLKEVQRALGYLGLRHGLVKRLFRLATDWLPEDQLLTQALELVAEAAQAEATSVLMVDRQEDDLYFAAATGPVSEGIKNYRFDRNEGIAGWCIESGRVLRISNVQAEARWHRQISEAVGYEVRQILAAPIRVRNRTIGCLELVNKLGQAGEGFSPEDEEIVADAAECIGLLFALRGRRTSE